MAHTVSVLQTSAKLKLVSLLLAQHLRKLHAIKLSFQHR